MNEELPNYAGGPKPVPLQTVVERSVERDSAFSKPGHVGKGAASKGWKPAKGVRFRPTNERRGPGRPRVRKMDPRQVKYY